MSSERNIEGGLRGRPAAVYGKLRQIAAVCGLKPNRNQTKPNLKSNLKPKPKTKPNRAREGVSVVDVVVGAVGRLSLKARAELAGFLDSMGEEYYDRKSGE